MSGVNQHYIPQFLQRGFLTENKKSLFVFCKDGRYFQSNTRNIGASRFFYKGDNVDADEFITSKENDFALLVNDLRATASELGDVNNISDLLCHLELRSNAKRLQYQNATEVMAQQLKGKLYDPVVLMRYLRQNSEQLINPCHNQILYLSLLYGMDEGEVFEKYVFEKIVSEDSPVHMIIDFLMQKIIDSVPNIVKNAHVEAMFKTPDYRRDQLRKLSFQVFSTEGDDFILGDSMVLFQVDGDRSFKPTIDKADILKAVILPLSSDKLLVGHTGSYDLDAKAIRDGIAECSYDYFLASSIKDNQGLSEIISSSCYLMSDEEYESIANGCFKTRG